MSSILFVTCLLFVLPVFQCWEHVGPGGDCDCRKLSSVQQHSRIKWGKKKRDIYLLVNLQLTMAGDFFFFIWCNICEIVTPAFGHIMWHNYHYFLGQSIFLQSNQDRVSFKLSLIKKHINIVHSLAIMPMFFLTIL